MRINEVEQLVDITKKNIRFYEQQGLLNPARNENNRYREYSEEDVDMLRRIKLLRRLAVPISEIRRIQGMNIPLEDCMRRHIITLERESKNLEKIREMCIELAERGESFQTVDAEAYLQEMDSMEKGGVVFVDAKRMDKKTKKTGALLSAGVAVIFMGLLICLFAWCTWGIKEDPMPVGLFAGFSIILGAVIVGVLLSLKSRMKEIEGGEIYEASKY